VYLELPGNLGVLDAPLRKGVDRVEELVRLLPRAFLRGFAVQTEVRERLKMHGRSRNEVQNVGVLPEDASDHVSQVFQEVEAVCNLRSLGSSSSGCFGILAATVPAYYLDSRVLAEPPGESVRTPVR
jgi:hypothetical protein